MSSPFESEVIDRVAMTSEEIERQILMHRNAISDLYEQLLNLHKDLINIDLEQFKIPARIYNILAANDIFTLGDLMIAGEYGVSLMDGIGNKGIDTIQSILKQHNLRLPMNKKYYRLIRHKTF